MGAARRPTRLWCDPLRMPLTITISRFDVDTILSADIMLQCCNANAMTVLMQMLLQINEYHKVSTKVPQICHSHSAHDCTTAHLKLQPVSPSIHTCMRWHQQQRYHSAIIANSRRSAKGLLLSWPSAARTFGATALAVKGVAAPVACMTCM